MGLQAFPFRSTHPKCFSLVKKKQRKAKKNIRRVGNSICCHPTIAPLFKTELQSRKTPEP